MGLRIATNVTASMVQKNLRQTSRVHEKELNKLSSGKRIIQSADDPAGLAISSHLQAQSRGLGQAIRNANEGISLVQTAEGGMNESHNLLIRLRELSIQSASDNVGEEERKLLDMEYQQLLAEIDRIAQSSTFNGTHLLKGEGVGKMSFHVGPHSGEENIIHFDSNESDITIDNLEIDSTSVSDRDDALDAVGDLDEALSEVSAQRAKLGAIQARLQSTVNNLEIQKINQESANSVIMDTDIADSTSKIVAANILQSAGTAALAQANLLPNNAVNLIRTI